LNHINRKHLQASCRQVGKPVHEEADANPISGTIEQEIQSSKLLMEITPTSQYL